MKLITVTPVFIVLKVIMFDILLLPAPPNKIIGPNTLKQCEEVIICKRICVEKTQIKTRTATMCNLNIFIIFNLKQNFIFYIFLF